MVVAVVVAVVVYHRAGVEIRHGAGEALVPVAETHGALGTRDGARVGAEGGHAGGTGDGGLGFVDHLDGSGPRRQSPDHRRRVGGGGRGRSLDV